MRYFGSAIILAAAAWPASASAQGANERFTLSCTYTYGQSEPITASLLVDPGKRLVGVYPASITDRQIRFHITQSAFPEETTTTIDRFSGEIMVHDDKAGVTLASGTCHKEDKQRF
ncbi:hypothetical protein [Dyella silvae]|uniref:hypothetical protein n=1 Tax=Dyella silvae TaxID=2994424 RepID=UPI0022648016|nr:hypothetical protein [Dyella silvae]